MSETQSTGGAASQALAPKARRRPPRLLVVAALLHGLVFFFLLPPWMGEDEPWHVEYAHHIGTGHLPWGGTDQRAEEARAASPSQVQILHEIGGLEVEEVRDAQLAILDSMREEHFWARVDWARWGGAAENLDQLSLYFSAAHQPPLYYAIVGPFLALFGGEDMRQELWVARSLSLLAYLAVVLAAYALAVRVSDDPQVALLCAFLVAWWPMHARQAAVVNNDVLVKVFSAWTLVLALDIAREGLGRRRLLLAGALALAGLATKSTAAGALVPLVLACLTRGVRDGALGSARARLAAGALLLGLVAGIPLAYLLSHNPAIPLTLEGFRGRLSSALQPEFREEFLRTAVGAFNWYSRDLPQALHVALRAGLGLGAAGLAVAFLRRSPDLRRGLLGLCLSAVAAQLLLVVLRGTAAGRYAIPVLPACALGLALGLLALVPTRWRAPAVGAAAFALVLFDSYALWAGLVWNQYGVWGS